jgi:type IV secretory pathway VirB2 component (pilin)
MSFWSLEARRAAVRMQTTQLAVVVAVAVFVKQPSTSQLGPWLSMLAQVAQA